MNFRADSNDIYYFVVDFFNDFVGIGTGCLRNHTSGTRMTVDLTVVGITLGTKFNFSNILQTEYFTV